MPFREPALFLDNCSIMLPVSFSRPVSSLLFLLIFVAKTSNAQVTGPVIFTEDVGRFYDLYIATQGTPTVDQLQQDYLDKGTDGLATFAAKRNITAARIAEAISQNPELYQNAKDCAAVLPEVTRRLSDALTKLGEYVPDAVLPPVTIAIGRGRPVGIGSPDTGIQISLEALCGADFLNPNLEDRFVHVIAHEYIHVLQVPELVDGENLTVLEASLMEGGAEFVCEVISGQVAYSHLKSNVAGQEKAIETRFLADIDKTELSEWLYNMAPGRLSDLGYWVGYRIAKAYYRNAIDKKQAVIDIINLSDSRAFLNRSGWQPGLPDF